MAEILVIANNKGGVGKTTTASCLGAYMALVRSLRVLLVDLDSQCNLTSSLIDVDYDGDFFLPEHPEEGDRYDISNLINGLPVAPYPTRIEGVKLIPNVPTNIIYDSSDGIQVPRGEALESLVSFFDENALHELFDVIIIDTPPAKGLLTTAAIRASSFVLIPVVMERKPVEGLLGMIQKVTYERQYQDINQQTEIIGILPTKFDARMRLHKNYLTQLNSHELMPSLAELMIKPLINQGDLSSFVIKERAAIKEMELKGASPTTPFDMPKQSDVRKEWSALGRYVSEAMGV